MASLISVAQSIKVGPGVHPDTQMGPLVSARQYGRVTDYVASGLEQGGQIVTGGGRPRALPEENAGGYFLEPTIFTETDGSMRVVKEEIFGPVLVAMRWTDVDDLIKQANDTPYGLSAGIWTNNLTEAHRIAGALK